MVSIDKKILKLIRSSINSKFSDLHPPILNGDEKKFLSTTALSNPDMGPTPKPTARAANKK